MSGPLSSGFELEDPGMDQAYQKALKRRDTLRRELQEVEQFLLLWHRVIGTEAEHSSQSEDAQPDGHPAAPVSVPARSSARSQSPPLRSPSRQHARDIARRVILAKGLPMTRGELVAAFEAEGAPIAGRDPNRNVGTIMWRLRSDFVNIEGHGYWPKEVSLPPLGYQPEASLPPQPGSEENV